MLLLVSILFSSLPVFVPQANAQSPAVQKCLDFFGNVLGVDLSQCGVEVVSDINDSAPASLGGLPRETLCINLDYPTGSFQGVFEFLNGTYIYCTTSQLWGTINYSQPLPVDLLNRTKELLRRYQQYANTENLQDMANLLDSNNEMQTTTATNGNVALTISCSSTTVAYVVFYYAVNGIAFPSGLGLNLDGQSIGIADETQFTRVGNATLGVSPNEAAQIGLEAAQNITVSVEGNDSSYTDVPIALQSNPLSIFLSTAYREPFTEEPYYYMFFGPDGSQGRQGGVEVSVWADNGQVGFCQAENTYAPPTTLYPLPTPTYIPIPTPTSEPTQTSTPQPIQTSTTQPTQTSTPQPTASTTLAPPTFVEATTTTDGSTIGLPISGNISSTQMTNVTLSTDPYAAVTTLSFVVTGQSGSYGFGNITIPKSVLTNTTIPTVPSVLIDGAQALNQSYTQDATNFYISYIVHFSTHTVSIVFNPTTTASSTPIPAPSPTLAPHSSTTPTPNLPIWLAAVVVALVVVTGMTLYFRIVRRKA